MAFPFGGLFPAAEAFRVFASAVSVSLNFLIPALTIAEYHELAGQHLRLKQNVLTRFTLQTLATHCTRKIAQVVTTRTANVTLANPGRGCLNLQAKLIRLYIAASADAYPKPQNHWHSAQIPHQIQYRPAARYA